MTKLTFSSFIPTSVLDAAYQPRVVPSPRGGSLIPRSPHASSGSLGVIAMIIAIAVWIFGVAFCDRVAEEIDSNLWVARAIAAFLPVIGPVIYAIRRARFLRRKGIYRAPPIY